MPDSVIELNGESCSWCKQRKNCQYKRNSMEQTRQTIRNIGLLTPAYCSTKVCCDYYAKDNDEYIKCNKADSTLKKVRVERMIKVHG